MLVFGATTLSLPSNANALQRESTMIRQEEILSRVSVVVDERYLSPIANFSSPPQMPSASVPTQKKTNTSWADIASHQESVRGVLTLPHYFENFGVYITKTSTNCPRTEESIGKQQLLTRYVVDQDFAAPIVCRADWSIPQRLRRCLSVSFGGFARGANQTCQTSTTRAVRLKGFRGTQCFPSFHIAPCHLTPAARATRDRHELAGKCVGHRVYSEVPENSAYTGLSPVVIPNVISPCLCSSLRPNPSASPRREGVYPPFAPLVRLHNLHIILAATANVPARSSLFSDSPRRLNCACSCTPSARGRRSFWCNIGRDLTIFHFVFEH